MRIFAGVPQRGTVVDGNFRRLRWLLLGKLEMWPAVL